MKARTGHFDRTDGYHVIPMHAGVESGARALAHAFTDGLTARQDPGRPDFYSVEIQGVCYYFHVFEARRTAYLLSAELANGLALSPADTRATTPCHAC